MRYKAQGWGTAYHIRFGLGAGKPVYVFKPTWSSDWYVWLGYREFIENGAKPVQTIDEVINELRKQQL